MNLSRIIFILSILFRLESYGQEQVFPLSTNQALKATYIHTTDNNLRTTSQTVNLPFIDDFSREGVYPQTDLWIDSNVFVNSSYPDNPLTIGVATFDGLDKRGNPYNINAVQSQIADYLTSTTIDLSPFFNDTSVWLSFFYQPQGLGDAPENGDSLVLQFLDNAGIWNHIWSVPGRADTVFQRVSIRVSRPTFKHSGFRFRFYNYATVNGNRDHWHLDYITLKANSTLNDPIRDNGFIRLQYSLLKDFESMPYEHYKSLPSQSAELKTAFKDSIRNIDYGQTSFTYVATIKDEFGNTLLSSIPSTLSGSSNTIVPFSTSIGNFTFPVTSASKAEYLMKNFVSITGVQSNLNNDTVRYRQTFDNYYAYDDGSAEVGYGVTGNAGVKMAYHFDVKKPDTLRGIDIYFNPTGVNVASTLIQLCLWDQVSVPSNSDNLVYRQINQRPKNIDSINGFARYLFDTLLVVQPGPVWIGFIQNNPAILIGLGLDKNIDRHEHMFYQVDGFWDSSSVQGSWMMRPLFGDTLGTGVIGIDEPVQQIPFSISPQPADQLIQVITKDERLLEYEIYSLQGSLISTGRLETVIPTSNLPQGSYLLRITNPDKTESGSRVIVIQR
ncbi:MAG: T9SS type A sorting domain-containing protein [Bacteroidota bacterium]